ncbi:hypothetical protein PAHAL_2G166300 [Panicum hallii]|uniref:Uncharacterized protein n=1 Tax=Panicum hallii TaxID=206008 RepID=A0A2T8KPG6_9POAL|nr:hypothetical protein PAHAL_2G166300 [Panicum hallii]
MAIDGYPGPREFCKARKSQVNTHQSCRMNRKQRIKFCCKDNTTEHENCIEDDK